MLAHLSPYSEIITAATAARGDDAIMIEDIMRTEIFHSTLDWQSRAELELAACKAMIILHANRRFYTFALMERRLVMQEMKLEQQLAQQPATNSRTEKICQSLEQVRSELTAAREILNRLTDIPCATL
jgi:hypothetical protein